MSRAKKSSHEHYITSDVREEFHSEKEKKSMCIIFNIT